MKVETALISIDDVKTLKILLVCEDEKENEFLIDADDDFLKFHFSYRLFEGTNQN